MLIRRPAARQDLVEIVYHYIRNGSPATGRRFRERAEAAFERLSRMPGMGTQYANGHPALAELRFIPLSSPFKVYLVFYRPVTDGVEIVRVLHGARDVQGILDEEFGIAGDAEPDEATD